MNVWSAKGRTCKQLAPPASNKIRHLQSSRKARMHLEDRKHHYAHEGRTFYGEHPAPYASRHGASIPLNPSIKHTVVSYCGVTAPQFLGCRGARKPSASRFSAGYRQFPPKSTLGRDLLHSSPLRSGAARGKTSGKPSTQMRW